MGQYTLSRAVEDNFVSWQYGNLCGLLSGTVGLDKQYSFQNFFEKKSILSVIDDSVGVRYVEGERCVGAFSFDPCAGNSDGYASVVCHDDRTES